MLYTSESLIFKAVIKKGFKVLFKNISSSNYREVNITYISDKKGGIDQETMQSSTTPDPGYHIGKLQKKAINITNKS